MVAPDSFRIVTVSNGRRFEDVTSQLEASPPALNSIGCNWMVRPSRVERVTVAWPSRPVPMQYGEVPLFQLLRRSQFVRGPGEGAHPFGERGHVSPAT